MRRTNSPRFLIFMIGSKFSYVETSNQIVAQQAITESNAFQLLDIEDIPYTITEKDCLDENIFVSQQDNQNLFYLFNIIQQTMALYSVEYD